MWRRLKDAYSNGERGWRGFECATKVDGRYEKKMKKLHLRIGRIYPLRTRFQSLRYIRAYKVVRAAKA